MDGELTCDYLHGLVPTAYKCGTVWGIQIEVAGARLYHQGSADLDDEELRDEPVDVFLDFFAPLGGEEKFAWGAKLADLPAEVAGVSPDARVAALRRIDRPGIAS